MTATILRGDARHLPLADNSVDLIVTSPPYWSLRSYTDAGQHYDGQIGAEPNPAAYIASLVDCTREWMRVLKPSGSLWVNLGDSYATRYSSVRGGGRAGLNGDDDTRGRSGQNRTGIPEKSLRGLPWRYAIACIDQLGLILRAEVIWSKPNGLPESVTDRVRRSHEQWFMFVKSPRYFSAVDTIREAHTGGTHPSGKNATVQQWESGKGVRHRTGRSDPELFNPLGKLPGSVWTIPTQPLTVPAELGVDHFAAFPMEWPRRIIQGWSPSGVCTACGDGRRPVVERGSMPDPDPRAGRLRSIIHDGVAAGGHGRERSRATYTPTGEVCACPDTSAPTRPSVILDPFSGTGTTALVAHALGRHGIGVDMSADYCRLARWRTTDPGQLAAALEVEKPAPQVDGQGSLLDLFALDGGAA